MIATPRIKTALFSVSDKRFLTEFGSVLASEFGVKILSTGGTAKALRDANVPVTDVSEHTGFPECFDGRVKTLHPKVHGGLLYIRGNEIHEARARELAITPIDLVVVNLYPFRETIAKPNVTDADAIENIDIGGPSMLRSAAKNHASVTVVCCPELYGWIQEEMREHNGATRLELRRYLASQVFTLTAQYDAAIAGFMGKYPQPSRF